MVFSGYLSIGGTEIANAARTEAYVNNLLKGFPLRGCQGCEVLPSALGDDAYYSPLQDDAPWLDSSNPATQEFYGFYPVSLENFDSATTTTEVVQSIGAGGYNNIPRDATRELRVRGVLVAGTPLALEAGMTWLREALTTSLCNDHGGSCVGSTMCYYAACPEFTVCYSAEADVQDWMTVVMNGNEVSVVVDSFGTDLRVEGELGVSPAIDGLTYSWGVSQFVGDISNVDAQPLQSYGPVTPLRTNQVSNPRFRTNTATWTIATGALTQVAAGAPDGGGYGHVVPAGTAVLRTDVSNAPTGQNMLSFYARTPAGAGLFTVNIRSALDNSLVQTITFNAGTDWNLYTLEVPFARGNVLEFTTTSQFDLTMVLLEGATAILPYFDGTFTPEMPPTRYGPSINFNEYYSEWTGTPDASPSRMIWGQLPSFSFCGPDIYAWVQLNSGTFDGSGRMHAHWDSFERVSGAEQAEKYERTMHDVAILSGPTTTQELSTRVGVGRVVEFTLSAANPYAYGTSRDLLIRYPLSSLPVQSWGDIPAPPVQTTIIVDPDCPPVPTAPRPPAIPNSCIDGPGVWDRYFYQIPAEEVSAWSKTLPTITLNSDTTDLRQVRARLTPNPFEYPVATDNKENLAPNPSGEVSTAGWVATPGTTGVAAVTNPISPTAYGTRVIRSTWSTASTAAGGGVDLRVNGLTPGVSYAFSFSHVKSSINNRLGIIVTYYNASNVAVGSSFSTAQAVTAGTVYTNFFVNGAPAPAGTSYARMMIQSEAGTGYANWSVGSYLEVDAAMANIGAFAEPYFDGSTQSAGGWFYGWLGTPGLSISLGQQSVVDPYAYCGEFIISYLPADAELIVDGVLNRAWASVGGAESVPASNLLYGTDGTPIVWPQLTCGIPYLLTIDVPPGTGDDILLGLSLTRRD